MASVTARRNKKGEITSWRVQARHNGKMMSEWFPPHGEQAAWEYATQVQKRGWVSAQHWLNAKRDNPGTPTLEEFTHQYLDPASGMLTGIEPGTRKDYERISRNFLTELGHYPIDAITKDDIGRWVAWVEGQPSRKFAGELIAAKTVANYHALLSNVFRAAVERNLRPDNPAYRTKLTRGTPREPVFLSQAEFRAVYNAIENEHYKPLVAFLVGSQLRWSEATALNGADLRRDTDPPTVRVTKAWKKNPDGPPRIGPPKTKRGKRTVAIWDELADIIDVGRPDDFLFRGVRGGKVWYGGFLSRVWNPAVIKSGITQNPNPHDLRHTGASWLIADGKPLPHIQARLGHESIQTTINTYGHLLPDAHTQMAYSLRGAMSGVLEISTGTDTHLELED